MGDDHQRRAGKFLPARTAILLNQFTARGWLQSLAAPEFNNYGGEVTAGFDVTIAKPAGSPGAAEILLHHRRQRSATRWRRRQSTAAHSAGPIAIDIDAAKQIKARIKNGSDWSRLIDATFTLPELFPVRITELHYHPADHPGVTDPDDLEFIELLNTGSQTVSLAGVQIAQFAAQPYTFGNGINLAAGERIIVARNPAVFQSVYGNGINLAPVGYATPTSATAASESNCSDRSESCCRTSRTTTSPRGPRRRTATARSLEIIDPLGDPANPANWRASAAIDGSPGAETNLPIPGDYDGNGTVEQSDYSFWRMAFGSTVAAGTGADGNGDGNVDTADYVIWRKNLGMSQAGGASLSLTDDSLPPSDGSTAGATAFDQKPLAPVSRQSDSQVVLFVNLPPSLGSSSAPINGRDKLVGYAPVVAPIVSNLHRWELFVSASRQDNEPSNASSTTMQQPASKSSDAIDFDRTLDCVFDQFAEFESRKSLRGPYTH